MNFVYTSKIWLTIRASCNAFLKILFLNYVLHECVVSKKWNIEQSVSFPHYEKLFIAPYDITQFRPRKFFSKR